MFGTPVQSLELRSIKFYTRNLYTDISTRRGTPSLSFAQNYNLFFFVPASITRAVFLKHAAVIVGAKGVCNVKELQGTTHLFL
jgi:hypothetical protein